MNWNDLRYVLAIGRKSRIAEAARLLRVDDTTVTRRLAALEADLGRHLYHRLAGGTLELTETGQALAALAERMVKDLGTLTGGTNPASAGISGTIRLTAVPFVVNRILVPASGKLLQRFPELRLELIADSRDLSLTRREADMALRLARPQAGGLRVKTRRVGVLRFAPYVAKTQSTRRTAPPPWIGYDEAMGHLPQARWMQDAMKKDGGLPARLRVNDLEAALEAVAAGHGQTMLPCMIADADNRLRKLPVEGLPQDPARELWLLVHADLAGLERARVVARWIEDLFSKVA